jgi:hypothetical protein
MATTPITTEQARRLTAWVQQIHGWQRRVRRDILAHEVFFKEHFPDEWSRWSTTWQLSKDESAADAHAKTQALLDILGLEPDSEARSPQPGKPGDPGDPPMPPLP